MLEQQQTMGDDFATQEQLGMALGGDKGYLAPRGDEETLKGRAERKRMLKLGQMDMMIREGE